MQLTQRLDTKRFCLRSFGHGAAFCLTYLPRNREVFLQGEDAAMFHDEWCRLMDAKPHWDNDGTLGEMWLRYLDVATDTVA